MSHSATSKAYIKQILLIIIHIHQYFLFLWTYFSSAVSFRSINNYLQFFFFFKSCLRTIALPTVPVFILHGPFFYAGLSKTH